MNGTSLMEIIRRRFIVFVSATVLVFAVACAIIFMRHPSYQAVTRASVDIDSAELRMFPEVKQETTPGSDARFMATQAVVANGAALRKTALRNAGASASDVESTVVAAPGADVLEFRAVSSDPDTAVRFSVGMSKAFSDYLLSQRNSKASELEKALAGRIEEQIKQIERMFFKTDCNRSGWVSVVGDNCDKLRSDWKRLIETNEAFERRRLELMAIKENASSPVTVFDPATEAREISGGNRPLVVVLSLALALCLGFATAIVVQRFDDAIYTVEDVRRLLGLPILAKIPHIIGLDQPPPIMIAKPQSTAAGVFRELAEKILSANGKGNVVLATSSIVQEGKTTVIVNTAIALAQTGASVLIVDADIHHPTVHEFLGVRNQGLIEHLLNDEPVESLIRESSVKGLQVLTSGSTDILDQSPYDSTYMIKMQRFSELIAEMSKKYDYVLLDSPPLLILSDAVVLLSMSEYVVFVVNSGMIRKQGAIQAKARLESVRPIFGVALNKTSGANGK